MQPRDSAEKELLKENLYRNRVQEILRKYRGSLQEAYNNNSSGDDADSANIKKQYASESAIIEKVMSNERSAFLSGIVLSGLVFASVRFGPRYLITKINSDKARSLREADAIAEIANTRWIQKTFSFLFEVSFGAWAGWRGYNILSSQNNNSSYDEIAKIPLCEGRSKISEAVCPEWVDLVHREIPKPFWQNLDEKEESKLKDPKRWTAVLSFADNCIKRKVYEDSYRTQHELKSGVPVDVPKGGVPEDILLSVSKSN